MRTIILTYGIPASGKSTWTKEQLRKEPGRFKRVNKDDLRMLIDNDVFTLENEKFILAIRDKIVEKALRNGWDVIVDDTNFPVGGKHFLRMCEIAKLVGDVQVIEKYFDITIKEAILRNTKREHPVPEDIVYSMYDRHIRNNRFECQTVYFPPLQQIQRNLQLPAAVIFDIDGTLALRGDRGAFDWHKVGVDLVNEPILSLYYDTVRDGVYGIIVSGRDSVCKPETEDWLKSNNIFYDYLFMRPENDNRKDVIVKKEIYENHIKGRFDILCVFDDRNQVVDMWRSEGLTCLQVAPGDF